jgi:hypothetical protein
MRAVLSARSLNSALLVAALLAVAFGQLLASTAAADAIQVATPSASPSASPTAVQPSSTSPEQQLADKYAPIAYLKAQKKACDSNGEQYEPAPVEIVFDDPAVTLEEGEDATVIAAAPAATALVNTTDEHYLNLPGNPRNPKCDYETHLRERMLGRSPTTYARIVVDEDKGKLALQYWFYYYFNLFKKLLSLCANRIAACQSIRK